MKKILLIIVVIMFLSACASGEEQVTPTPELTNTPAPTATATHTPQPTATFTPQPTATPLPDQDTLKEDWQPAIGGVILQYAICPMIIDTAQKLQAGEIDGWGAFAEMVFEATFINALDESLIALVPIPAVRAHKETLLAHNTVMKQVLADWYNSEISSADVPGLLEEECAAIETSMNDIVADAKAHGMSDDSLNVIMTEMEQSLAEMEQSLSDMEDESDNE